MVPFCSQIWRGQFRPFLGGHFKPFSGGQFKPQLGGQFDRFLQLNSKVRYWIKTFFRVSLKLFVLKISNTVFSISLGFPDCCLNFFFPFF